MNILICGAGEVGRHAAEVLGQAGHSITLIDHDPQKLEQIEDTLDVSSMAGNGTQADVLLEAGCAGADVFLAATNVDEVNLLAAAVAKGVGARRSIARVHHSAFFEQRGLRYDRYLGIDHLVCPEYATAVAIAQTLRSPGALAVERFARGQIEVQQLPVSANAPAVGKTLAELQLPPSARIGAIERDQSAFIPDRQTRLKGGDIVTLIADLAVLDQARTLLRPKAHQRGRVVILGGTSQGVWLCRSLHSRSFSVRLIESNRQRAEELAAKLDWVTVLHADVADQDFLEQERLDQADAFVALTSDDESNILGAALAKHMGTRNVMAVLQRSTYLHLIGHVGIDRAFSPRSTAVNEIQHLLEQDTVRHLATLAGGIADVFEVQVPAGASVLNRPLKDIRFPPRTMVAAIQRGEHAQVPTAAATIQAGDRVVIIGPSNARKTLRRFFEVT